jgi:hypothetical protein
VTAGEGSTRRRWSARRSSAAAMAACLLAWVAGERHGERVRSADRRRRARRGGGERLGRGCWVAPNRCRFFTSRAGPRAGRRLKTETALQMNTCGCRQFRSCSVRKNFWKTTL